MQDQFSVLTLNARAIEIRQFHSEGEIAGTQLQDRRDIWSQEKIERRRVAADEVRYGVTVEGGSLPEGGRLFKEVEAYA